MEPKKTSIEITGNTFRTSNYDMFKRLEGNRNVLQTRVKKIKANMERNGYIFNPIVVNESHEVIDGQGRLEALRLLNLPVDFVIAENTGLAQCVALNSGTTPWKLADFIESYCEIGNENYIRTKELIDKFPELGLQIKIAIITGKAPGDSTSVKNGKIFLPENRMQEAEDDLNFADRFVGAFKRVNGTTNYYFYTVIFARRCGADPERLIRTIERAELAPAPKMRNALDIVSDIYNKNLKDQRNRIYLFQKYEESMTEKYGWYDAKWRGRD